MSKKESQQNFFPILTIILCSIFIGLFIREIDNLYDLYNLRELILVQNNNEENIKIILKDMENSEIKMSIYTIISLFLTGICLMLYGSNSNEEEKKNRNIKLNEKIKKDEEEKNDTEILVLSELRKTIEFLYKNKERIPISLFTYNEFKLLKIKQEIETNKKNSEDKEFMNEFNVKAIKIIEETKNSIEKNLLLEEEKAKQRKMQYLDNIKNI